MREASYRVSSILWRQSCHVERDAYGDQRLSLTVERQLKSQRRKAEGVSETPAAHAFFTANELVCLRASVARKSAVWTHRATKLWNAPTRCKA